jgi:hypothetical protein
VEAASAPEAGEPAAGQGFWDPDKWEEVVGGQSPTKINLTITDAKMELPPGKVKKGDIVEFRVVARVGGFDSDDKIDSKTGAVVDNHLKFRARAQSVSIARKVQEAS